MKPRLAAAIPTHNRPRDLREAIDSVRRQDIEVEIVVADDGSQPPVDPAVLPPDVKVVRHDVPSGPAGARNAAAHAAEAEWVAYLDDDDRWLPGKARAVLDAARQFPDADVIFHRTADAPAGDGGSVRRVPEPLLRVLRSQPPHLSGVAVRREYHESVRFDETMWATQDIDYLIRLARGGTWVELPQILSIHADEPETKTAIDVESRIAGRLGILERHGDLIRSDPQAHSFFYARLGHQYRRGGRRREARDCFLRSIRLRPASRVAWSGLVRLYLPWLPPRP